MEGKLQILLATYNSERYLRSQIDSLLAQDYRNFQIVVRDGGSSDNTVAIVSEYQEKYPDKFAFLGSRKASAIENFSELLNASSAELVMFCDHDDVWYADKISRTLAKYKEFESQYGSQTPIMVFTDSCVTDQDLNVISPSMLRYQHLDVKHLSLNRLIPQNAPSGNTMLVNRALADLALPIPSDAVMHDHWITLVAAAFGKIAFLNEPTLYYRQHDGNVYGALNYSLPGIVKKSQTGREKIRNRFEKNIRQAAAFGKRYKDRLTSEDAEMFSALERWNEYGFWKKRKVLLKHHIFKSGLLRNLGMFALV